MTFLEFNSHSLRHAATTALCASLFFGGCLPTTSPDAGIPDGGSVDGGDNEDAGRPVPQPDAGPGPDGGPPPSDAGPPPVLDAGPDDSLEGTPFADATVRWMRDLELCTTWSEGAPLASEHARKVRLHIPRQPRATLGQEHLGQSQLTHVVIETGVDQSERFRTQNTPSVSTLTRWEVVEPANNNSSWVLYADIEHAIADGAGTVVEQYEFYRNAGDGPFEVQIGEPNTYGANFLYIPAGGTIADAIGIRSCDPEIEPDVVVETLVGTIDTGPHAGRHVQVTRYARSFDVFAGSYPVYWDATDVMFTDRPYEGVRTFGYWPHTYSAQHHNWEENSRVLPLRDRGVHQLVTGGLDNGASPFDEIFTKVEWSNVTSDLSPGTLRVTLQDSTTGVDTVHDVRLLGAFHRVDASRLRRGDIDTCGGEVKYLEAASFGGIAGNAFQLLVCPDNTAPLGFTLQGVVPVAFELDGTLVGTQLGGDSIAPVATGFDVTLGTARLRVEAYSGSDVLYELIDSTGTALASGITPLRTLSTPLMTEETFEGSGAGVTFKLVRRYAAPGVGETAIYAPVSFEMQAGDEVFFVDGIDALLYTNSHHNWADALVATVGDVELRWAVMFSSEGMLEHRVSATRNGAEIVPDTAVEVTMTTARVHP